LTLYGCLGPRERPLAEPALTVLSRSSFAARLCGNSRYEFFGRVHLSYFLWPRAAWPPSASRSTGGLLARSARPDGAEWLFFAIGVAADLAALALPFFAA